MEAYSLWKKEFVKTLFSSDPSELNPKRAICLKYENVPSALYKYTGIDDSSLDLLETDRIFLSTPDKFNDPFDCAINLVTKDLSNEQIKKLFEYNSKGLREKFGVSDKELGKLLRSKNFAHELVKYCVKRDRPNITLKERDKEIKRREYKFLNDCQNIAHKEYIHVTCFSETKESILMWSHYANNHEGFCVEYNFKELEINNPINRFIFPVNYTKSVFDVSKNLVIPDKEFDDILKEYLDEIDINRILKGLMLPERNKNTNNMVIFYSALNKSMEWCYEREWRYVFPYKDLSNKMEPLKLPKPKSIYLGAEICKENYEKILKIGKERGINVYKMSLKPSEFALEPHILHECTDVSENH